MNKQEAIEKIKNIDTLNINDKIAGQQVDMVIKNQVLDIVSHIDEPKKVTIPKFVAEWIVETEKIHNNLSWVWFSNPVSDELNAWLKNHTETFMRAWLDGYEVETEKLYTVEIPDPYGAYKIRYLFRNDMGNLRIGGGNYRDIFLTTETHLTESEIKQDFKWAWDAGFAKPVEEN